jgi:O-antigen/teichoic acid export membrane protein
VRSTRYVTLLALPAVIALLLFPDLLVLAWTGRPAPAGTAATARLVVLAVAAMIVVSPLRLLLRASGRAGLEAAATAAGALVQLVAAAALAGRLGAPGVGLATLAGSLVALGLVASGGRRSRASALSTADAARAAAPSLLAGLGALAAGLLAALVLPAATASDRAGAFAALAVRLLPSGLVFGALAWWGRAAGPDEILLLRDAVRPQAHASSTREAA